MSKPIVIFDADEVLVNLAPGLCSVLNEATGLSIVAGSMTSYGLTNHYPLSTEECLAIAKEKRCLELAVPMVFAKEAVDKVKTMGYQAMVLTARGWHPDAMNITTDWFDQYEIRPDEVHIVDHTQSKADYIIKHWGCVEYVIDDNYDHISEINQKAAAHHAVLRAHSWNQGSGYSELLTAYSLRQFIRMLEMRPWRQAAA